MKNFDELMVDFKEMDNHRNSIERFVAEPVEWLEDLLLDIDTITDNTLCEDYSKTRDDYIEIELNAISNKIVNLQTFFKKL